jgi:hypothetical protein
VCIGEAMPLDAWNWNSGNVYAWRDKKEVFLSTYHAMEFYVRIEELKDRSRRRSRIKQLVQLLSDEHINEEITRRINEHASDVEEQLVQTLREKFPFII